MSILDEIIGSTYEYIEKMPKEQRKQYGQFFTSKETARFMAELFNIPENTNELSILDPGAGSGVLSAALIERLQNCPNIKSVYLTCYETDDNIVELLESNLEYIKNNTSLKMTFDIVRKNFITSQEDNYNGTFLADPAPTKYDMVIGNPPYKKIPKDAAEALSMPDICYGAPNLYFLFSQMSLFDLKENGEMVYIIPRSWTSGAYFKAFRQKFLSQGAIEHIHLFVSRDKVFEKESVLQETIIINVKKTEVKPEYITVTSTNSNQDFTEITTFSAPYKTVISGDDCYVYLVTNEDEVNTLDCLNKFDDTLPSLGLKMKTGLTVDFRNHEALRSEAEKQAVPLFYSQHIQDGKVVFPIGKENEYIVTQQQGLLQKNANYLFVKRFTAKEEHRRLQCGVYIARKHTGYDRISTQNKINFIDGLKGLSECVVYGLYVLFNSTLYDSYYRILNGSTQVNSTEVNSMPMPPMTSIEAMGKELIKVHDMSEASCDRILRSYV